MMRKKLLGPAIVVAALAAAAPAQADSSSPVTVCNEAENSFRGGYVLTGGPVDPVPPAFNRGSRMAIGGGRGVEHAAEMSPALRLCGPDAGGGGGDV